MAASMNLAEKTQLVRAVLDAYGNQDLEAILEHLHTSVEWVPPIALAEGRTFRGHAGVREWWEDLISTFEGFSAEVEQFREAGDGLLALGRILSYGRGSGVEISDEVGWLWEFRDGKINRMRIYLGHDEALKAVEGN